MMDGEEVYRARLMVCLAAAEEAALPQVKERHLAAARSWQTLLEATVERKRGALENGASVSPEFDDD